MIVYAVKYYVPYEEDSVYQLYFDLEDAKKHVDERIKGYENEYEQKEGEIYGFYAEWGDGYYIEEYTVK